MKTYCKIIEKCTEILSHTFLKVPAYFSPPLTKSSQNSCLYTVPLNPLLVLPLHLLPCGFCPINSTKPDPAKVTGGICFQVRWDRSVLTCPVSTALSLKHTSSLQFSLPYSPLCPTNCTATLSQCML